MAIEDPCMDGVTRRHFDGEQSIKKQPSRGVPRKRCFENMQHVYRKTRMPKCDLKKISKKNYCNHTLVWVFSCKFAAFCQNFQKSFYKNTYEGLLSDMDQNSKELAN